MTSSRVYRSLLGIESSFVLPQVWRRPPSSAGGDDQATLVTADSVHFVREYTLADSIDLPAVTLPWLANAFLGLSILFRTAIAAADLCGARAENRLS